ncbi:MAG: hypothetical protein JHC33_02535 [Ignisphaera sp.]|nr:hypothetical protein [Ignisphaera sp.]
MSEEITYSAANAMTKRELLAAMAMQGILSSLTDDSNISADVIADYSLRNADALLAALEEA